MATVTQRINKNGSTSYEIRVSLGRDQENKQILEYKTFTPTPGMSAKQIEKALEREKVLFEEQCRSGQYVDGKIKFADIADMWLEKKKTTHSPAYHVRVLGLLERINTAIGHLPVNKIQPHHLESFYKNLAEPGVKMSGKSATSRNLSETLKQLKLTKTALAQSAGVSVVTIRVACQGGSVSHGSAEKIAKALNIQVDKLFVVENTKSALSDKTVLQHHRILNVILEFAVKQKAILENPARRAESPKVKKKESAYLDDKQVIDVINKLDDAPLKWKTILMLLLYSGMRRGELCGLVWSDIDFNNNIIHITKANQYLPEKGIFEKDTKTESSNRVNKFPAEMFALFREYKKQQLANRLKMGDRWHDTGKVFTQENGKPIHPDSITRWVAKFRESNNLPYFTPHTLRHTSATLLIMQGVPVKAVSARLGHSSQNVTNMIYSHSIQTVDAMASDILGDILKPIESGVSKKIGY